MEIIVPLLVYSIFIFILPLYFIYSLFRYYALESILNSQFTCLFRALRLLTNMFSFKFFFRSSLAKFVIAKTVTCIMLACAAVAEAATNCNPHARMCVLATSRATERNKKLNHSIFMYMKIVRAIFSSKEMVRCLVCAGADHT